MPRPLREGRSVCPEAASLDVAIAGSWLMLVRALLLRWLRSSAQQGGGGRGHPSAPPAPSLLRSEEDQGSRLPPARSSPTPTVVGTATAPPALAVPTTVSSPPALAVSPVPPADTCGVAIIVMPFFLGAIDDEEDDEGVYEDDEEDA